MEHKASNATTEEACFKIKSLLFEIFIKNKMQEGQ